MSLTYTVSAMFSVPASTIYDAWLDSTSHAEMTSGGAAIQSKEVGAVHQAHGDYIHGVNLELVDNQKIVQSWRSTGFTDEDEDSKIVVILEEQDGGTLLTLTHSNLPSNQAATEQGWHDYYFTPMKAYFTQLAE